MALKQVLAMQALENAGCEAIIKSLCEIPNGWLALVNTANGKRLATAVKGENPLKRRQVESTSNFKGVDVDIMALNSVNAAEVRHAVKWTAPVTCGTKGLSVGFCDYLNIGAGFLTDIFAKKQMRPVLADITPETGVDLIAGIDALTWSVLESGYRDGYGANAAELEVKAKNFSGFNFDEDIYKALAYGYKTIGLECSDKIDLSIEKLSDEQVEKRFEEFNEVFRAAVDASYLKVEFKVGNNKISFQPAELHRIVLEYGEAIMHIQNVYNTFLKSAPWDIDFEVAISKPGKILTPTEHCLIANELQRNGIKVAALCLDVANDGQSLSENIEIHADIAETYGYRLSLKNADIALENPAAANKALKGRVHFKANNILWMSTVKFIAENNAELYAKMAAAVGADAVAADAICGSATAKAFAKNYAAILDADKELAAEVKAYIAANVDAYKAFAKQNIENCFLKRI